MCAYVFVNVLVVPRTTSYFVAAVEVDSMEIIKGYVDNHVSA